MVAAQDEGERKAHRWFGVAGFLWGKGRIRMEEGGNRGGGLGKGGRW